MSVMQSKKMIVSLTWAMLVLSGTGVVKGQEKTPWYARGSVQYEQRLKLTLKNPLAVERQGEPMVIPMEAIRKVAPDFAGKSFVVVDPAAAVDSPCGIEANGNDVPSQADDLDGDGKADELLILASLKANESKTLYIYFTAKDVPRPLYPKKTQIMDFVRADPKTLFAIESDVLAFRFNRMKPDTPGFTGDVLAKNKQFPGYNLHMYDQKIPLWTYGAMVMEGWITHDAFMEYADLTPVGRCVLNPEPEQFGLGSILAQQGKDWKMALAPSNATQAKIILDGRLRSIGEIETLGWQVGGGIYDVKARYTMFAGQRYARCDLTIASQKGQGGRFAVGLMKLANEQTDIGLAEGRVSVWGDRPSIRERGVGIAALFRPGDMKAIGEAAGGRAIELKESPAAGKPLVATLYLSAGCKDDKRPMNYGWAASCPDLVTKSCGDCKDAQEFFGMHADLARKVSAPVTAEIGTLEANTPQTARQPFKAGDYFLANPSSKPLALPGELDLGLLGLDGSGGVEANAKGVAVDLVTFDGSSRVLIGKAVESLGVEKIALKAGGGKGAASGIKVEEISGAQGGVAVTTVKAKWVMTESGLKNLSVGGKDLAIEQTGVTGAVKVVHSGPVATIVRVGNADQYTDYYFFKGTDIVRVVANHALGFQSKAARSYLGKKSMYVAGCERTEVSNWGEWSSDGVFKKETVLYPAEWSALYSPENKAGMICYGSPSAPAIVVEKGGKLDAALATGCRSQELYLAPLEDIRQASDLWPVMSRPFVLAAHGEGFACCEDRNGNGVQDTFQVTDRNKNGKPDFDGDRWEFDMDSDDALQMVLEFEAKPRQMKVYCDTVSGSRLHSNHLSHYFGDTPPTWGGSPPHHKYDGCLSAAELQEPFYVYESIGDGFFKGPVTEGGFIASGKVTGLRDGPSLSIVFARKVTVTSLDLDSDGDCDIYYQDSADMMQNNGIDSSGKHERYVNYIVPDFSDSNLEPLTVINPYTGLAFHAIRYFSFLMLDNSKIYQGGCSDKGVITGGQNWPQAGTWDIDNDGAAEGYIYHEMTHTLGLDLAKKRTAKDEWLRERQHYQRDLFEEKITLPVNFGILTIWPKDLIDSNPQNDISRRNGWVVMRPLMLPVGIYPVRTYKDPHGNSVSLHADFLPDKWHGERLECKTWPDGQWDFWPNNNWNSFVKQKHLYVRVNFWHPGRDNGGDHEGCNTQMLTWPNPQMRSEVDTDGTESFYIYQSPFLNGLHFRGLHFGIQIMPDNNPYGFKVPDTYKNAYYLAGGASKKRPWVNLAEYSDEYANTCGDSYAYDYNPSARQGGKMFLYYVDDDRDGYADAYILDDENDGYFEKRMWYQKNKGILSFYDNGVLGVVARKLEFPGYALELKNYEKLVEIYRESLTRPGLLREVAIKDGKCEKTGAPFSAVLSGEWLPRVAVDAIHVEGKDSWNDYGPGGLDTLGRVISEYPVTIEKLDAEYARENLAGIDVLVIERFYGQVSSQELDAVEEYVKNGGTVLILVDQEAAGEVNPLGELANRLGIKIEHKKTLSLIPGQCKWSEIIPGMKETGKAGLLEGVAPVFLEARQAEYGSGAKTLLEYRGHPLIVEARRGKGRVILVPANMFLNDFMCLPPELRKMPFKPGNQQLAKNLAKYLLGGVMPRVQAMENSETKAQMQITGRGGEIRFQVPWKEGVIRLNGKDTKAESKDGTLALRLPQGESRVELILK